VTVGVRTALRLKVVAGGGAISCLRELAEHQLGGWRRVVVVWRVVFFRNDVALFTRDRGMRLGSNQVKGVGADSRVTNTRVPLQIGARRRCGQGVGVGISTAVALCALILASTGVIVSAL